MGIFNQAIPKYTIDPITNTPTQELPTVDDIFDPILNKNVRDAYRNVYGNGVLPVLEGYQDLLTGIWDGSPSPLGKGMGLLSSFGRSMDKADDFLLGGATELVNSLNGQGGENPFMNIFVNDEDYTGQRFLASTTNLLGKLVGDDTRVTEKDFNGAWNIPSMGLELATDPGILGGTLAKTLGGAATRSAAKRSSKEILQGLGKSGVKSAVADVGQLLSDYDDTMSRIAIDITAPGLRPAFKSLKGRLFHHLAAHSAKDLADVEILVKTVEDTSLPPEVRIEAQQKLAEIPFVKQMDDLVGDAETKFEAAGIPEDAEPVTNVMSETMPANQVQAVIPYDYGTEADTYTRIRKARGLTIDTSPDRVFDPRNYSVAKKRFDEARKNYDAETMKAFNEFVDKLKAEGVSLDYDFGYSNLDADPKMLSNARKRREARYRLEQEIRKELKIGTPDTLLNRNYEDSLDFSFDAFATGHFSDYEGDNKKIARLIETRVGKSGDLYESLKNPLHKRVTVSPSNKPKLNSLGAHTVMATRTALFDTLSQLTNGRYDAPSLHNALESDEFNNAMERLFKDNDYAKKRFKTLVYNLTALPVTPDDTTLRRTLHAKEAVDGTVRYPKRFVKDANISEFVEDAKELVDLLQNYGDLSGETNELSKLLKADSVSPDTFAAVYRKAKELGLVSSRDEFKSLLRSRKNSFVDKLRESLSQLDREFIQPLYGNEDGVRKTLLRTDASLYDDAGLDYGLNRYLRDLINTYIAKTGNLPDVPDELLKRFEIKYYEDLPSSLDPAIAGFEKDVLPLLDLKHYNRKEAAFVRLDSNDPINKQLSEILSKNPEYRSIMSKVLNNNDGGSYLRANRGKRQALTRSASKYFDTPKTVTGKALREFKERYALKTYGMNILNVPAELQEAYPELKTMLTDLHKKDAALAKAFLDETYNVNMITDPALKNAIEKVERAWITTGKPPVGLSAPELRLLGEYSQTALGKNFDFVQMTRGKTTYLPDSPNKLLETINYNYFKPGTVENADLTNWLRNPYRQPWVETPKVSTLNVDKAMVELYGSDPLKPKNFDYSTAYKPKAVPKALKKDVTESVTVWMAKQMEEMPTEELTKYSAGLGSPTEDAAMDVINEIIPEAPEIMEQAPKLDAPAAEAVYEKWSLFKHLRQMAAKDLQIKGGSPATLRTARSENLIKRAADLISRDFDGAAFKKHAIARAISAGDVVTKDELWNTFRRTGVLQAPYKKGSDKLTTVYNALRKNADAINNAVGKDIVEVFQEPLAEKYVKRADLVNVGMRFRTNDTDIVKRIRDHLSDITKAKFVDIPFADANPTAPAVAKYMSSGTAAEIDDFLRELQGTAAEQYKVLGFNFGDQDYVKHVMSKNPGTAQYLKGGIYGNTNLDDIDEIVTQLSNFDEYRKLDRGTFGAMYYDKRFRGNWWDYYGENDLYDFDPITLVKSTLSEGAFSNYQYQLYTDLFENKNFNIHEFVKSEDDLRKIFTATLEDGSESGNLYNLELIAPRKDATGKLIGFTKFDKSTDKGLAQALANPATILAPANLVSNMDKLLRKDVRMSNKLWMWVNKHFTIPFKFGVLTNPGFLLGNVGDAWFKQAETMAAKYGTDVASEVAATGNCVNKVISLRNSYTDAFGHWLEIAEANKLPLSDTERLPSMLESSAKSRDTLLAYLRDELADENGRNLYCALSKREQESILYWFALKDTVANDMTSQVSDVLQEMNGVSKYAIENSGLDRITQGSVRYDPKNYRTWGIFVNNPYMNKIMQSSEAIEDTMRTACVLNDLQHKRYTLKEIAGWKGYTEIPKDAPVRQFTIDAMNANNAMFNANFDYERISDFMDGFGKAVPFPTFFLKNFSYWLEMWLEHPQRIQNVLRVQDSLWAGRDTSNDEFVASAKGRGALPVGGKALPDWFKGYYKPSPITSMYGAFSLLNNPVDDISYRLHPAINAAAAVSGLTTSNPDDVKYRPYSLNPYERNIKKGDPKFNPVKYSLHNANPFERSMQTAMRLPSKLTDRTAQVSDFLPSVFQPDFSKK